jgi:hypothetical protein
MNTTTRTEPSQDTGTGPLYHDAHGDDLPDIIDKVMRALTR